jgi:hypothetical protein
MAYPPITNEQCVRLKQLQEVATSTEYMFTNIEDEPESSRKAKARTINVCLHNTEICPNHWRIEGTLFEGRFSFKVLAPSLELAIDNSFAMIQTALVRSSSVTADAKRLLEQSQFTS